jgi:membrane fusion protein (multidrug efflux system)
MVVAALVVLLVSWGCEKPQGPPAGPPPAPEVAFVTAQPQKVVLTTELPGRTAPCLVSQVMPQVNGLIQKRLFTEGADVKAGAELYRIDPAPFQAAFDGAVASLDAANKAADRARAALNVSTAGVERQRATLALANINRERFKDLATEKAVSTLARDQAATAAEEAQAALRAAEAQVESDRAAIAAAEAAIKQAEAAVQASRINLGYTKITAPISGRIGRSHVTEGAYVAAYQAVLATIQQLDPIYVDVPQSTVERNRLKRNMENSQINHNGAGQDKVRLTLEDGTAYPLEGELQFDDVTVDPTTGSVIRRILVPNPDGVLLPGMYVRAAIVEGEDDDAILIPQQAVTRDHKGNALVFVISAEGKAQPRPVQTDRALGDQWIVSSGLAPGDRVIVEGLLRVRPGMMVSAVPFVPARKQDAGPDRTTRPDSRPK